MSGSNVLQCVACPGCGAPWFRSTEYSATLRHDDGCPYVARRYEDDYRPLGPLPGFVKTLTLEAVLARQSPPTAPGDHHGP